MTSILVAAVGLAAVVIAAVHIRCRLMAALKLATSERDDARVMVGKCEVAIHKLIRDLYVARVEGGKPPFDQREHQSAADDANFRSRSPAPGRLTQF